MPNMLLLYINKYFCVVTNTYLFAITMCKNSNFSINFPWLFPYITSNKLFYLHLYFKHWTSRYVAQELYNCAKFVWIKISYFFAWHFVMIKYFMFSFDDTHRSFYLKYWIVIICLYVSHLDSFMLIKRDIMCV